MSFTLLSIQKRFNVGIGLSVPLSDITKGCMLWDTLSEKCSREEGLRLLIFSEKANEASSLIIKLTHPS